MLELCWTPGLLAALRAELSPRRDRPLPRKHGNPSTRSSWTQRRENTAHPVQPLATAKVLIRLPIWPTEPQPVHSPPTDTCQAWGLGSNRLLALVGTGPPAPSATTSQSPYRLPLPAHDQRGPCGWSSVAAPAVGAAGTEWEGGARAQATKSVHACHQLGAAGAARAEITNGCHCGAKNL